MTTYGDMQARIANELMRSDLTSEIKLAIQDAINLHSSKEFWFNRTRSLTFNTVVGQRAYGAADLADIATMPRIDEIFQTQGSSLIPLERVSAAEMEDLHTPSSANGRPVSWTWIENEIHFWPTPNAVFSTRLVATKKLSTLSADTDLNAWMTDGERLIRSAAKRILFEDVIRVYGQDYASALKSEDEEIDRLLTETHKRMPRGTIQGTCF